MALFKSLKICRGQISPLLNVKLKQIVKDFFYIPLAYFPPATKSE